MVLFVSIREKKTLLRLYLSVRTYKRLAVCFVLTVDAILCIVFCRVVRAKWPHRIRENCKIMNLKPKYFFSNKSRRVKIHESKLLLEFERREGQAE